MFKNKTVDSSYNIPKILWLKPKELFKRFGKVVGFVVFFAILFVGIDALVVLINQLVG